MENSILEILTYYVIGGALLIGAPGVFFFIVFQPALQNTRVAWLDIKITKLMEILPSTKTQKVIQTNTSYKLAEIIRDTWPQLFYLKGAKNNDRTCRTDQRMGSDARSDCSDR